MKLSAALRSIGIPTRYAQSSRFDSIHTGRSVAYHRGSTGETAAEPPNWERGRRSMSIKSGLSLRGRRAHRRAVGSLVGAIAGAAVLFAAAPAADASKFERLPILFVHGFESAGSNFASQSMRFESNGYPHEWVEELDYNSTGAVANMSEVEKQIEAAITALKQRTGKSQVDVVGHSEGTSVMYQYMAE